MLASIALLRRKKMTKPRIPTSIKVVLSVVIFATSVSSQNSATGRHEVEQRNCNNIVALTGDVNVNCAGLSPEQQKILADNRILLNRLYSKQRDQKAQMDKIEAILKELKSVSSAAVAQEPHIQAQLAIESLADNSFKFSVQLENIGEVTIAVSNCILRGDSGSTVETPTVFGTTNLVPRAKIAISGLPEFGQMWKGLDVLLTYKAFVGGAITTHYSIYKFEIPQSEWSKQPILPGSILEGAGITGDKEIKTAINFAIQAKFLDPVGTIELWLPERNPEGYPNAVAIRAGHRMLLVNTTTRKAAIVADFPSGRKVIVLPLDAGKSDLHFVVVEWDDQEQTIALAADSSNLIQK
jgi:hypothetical protein